MPIKGTKSLFLIFHLNSPFGHSVILSNEFFQAGQNRKILKLKNTAAIATSSTGHNDSFTPNLFLQKF